MRVWLEKHIISASEVLLSASSHLGKKGAYVESSPFNPVRKPTPMRTYNQLTQTERYQIYALRTSE